MKIKENLAILKKAFVIYGWIRKFNLKYNLKANLFTSIGNYADQIIANPFITKKDLKILIRKLDELRIPEIEEKGWFQHMINRRKILKSQMVRE